jgi:hypothetical protein
MPRAEKSLRLVKPAARPFTGLELEIYRETDIRLAAEGLFKEALRLHAIPRYPDLADYRADAVRRFEAAVKVMKEALSDA